MPNSYRAKDRPEAPRTAQSRPASSSGSAAQALSRQAYAVEEAADDSDELGGLFPRRIRKYDLIYVTNQLSVMVDTGITLSAALGSIMEEEQNPSMRKVLADLKSSVEAGDDFSTALSA